MTEASGRQSEGESNRSQRNKDWRRVHQGEATKRMVEADAKAFLHQSVSTPCLSAVVKAEGIWLEDADGRRTMDFHGNSAHHIGYGHPRLKEAVKAQMDRLPFAPRRFTCEPAIALAQKLAAIAPKEADSSGPSKMLFTTGGSDAVEVALKVARAATGRFKTISFWDAFHGAGFGASSVGGEYLFRGGPAGPLLPGSEHVAPFNCYRCPYGHPDRDGKADLEICKLACAQMVRYVLEREGEVAAVIAEPARALPVIPPPGYWKAVQEACREKGTLLIFDEIPTGLGKTGKMFACEHEGVVPDILVVGKSLGGGMLPIAACLVREGLDAAGEFAIGHYTHEKNPVTATAALTTLQIIEEEGLVERAAYLGEKVLSRLEEMKVKHRAVGDVRGRGLLFGLDLVSDRESKAPDEDLAEAVFYNCLSAELAFKITMGSVLTLSPPMTISETDLDRALDILDQALTTETGRR